MALGLGLWHDKLGSNDPDGHSSPSPSDIFNLVLITLVSYGSAYILVGFLPKASEENQRPEGIV
jgi:hypothetical protein